MAESWECNCVGEGTPKRHLDNCGTRVVPFSDYECLRDALAEQAETIERLTAALRAWYEASDDEERRWAMELTVPLMRGADEIRPGPQGQDRREAGGCKPEMPQRKSLESSPGLPTPPVSR